MAKCPKCGGTSGFDFTRLERMKYFGSWEDADEFELIETVRVWFSGKVKCADCKKWVKMFAERR